MNRFFPILIIPAMVAAGGCARPGLQADAPAIRGYAQAAPVTGPATAGVYFDSQVEGLAAVVRELDAVTELVEIVSRLPQERGEFTISFSRIHADLAAMRAGLVEAIRKPTTAPRTWGSLGADYVQ